MAGVQSWTGCGDRFCDSTIYKSDILLAKSSASLIKMTIKMRKIVLILVPDLVYIHLVIENKHVGVIHLNFGTGESIAMGERCELIMLSYSLSRNGPDESKIYLPELASDIAREIGEFYNFHHVI
jgi:hypothetical protein